MISIRSISKRIGELEIIRAFSLEIRPGETAGIFGGNGTGKTLLLDMAAGVVAPDSGEIIIGEEKITGRWRKIARLIGYLPQKEETPEIDNMSVADYLDYAAYLHGLRAQESREMIVAMSELFDLRRVMEIPVRSLSTGERKRVRLAGEIMHDPVALILDDPLASLDSQWRRLICGIIGELSSMGKAILIASVPDESLQTLCDKILTEEDYAVRNDQD